MAYRAVPVETFGGLNLADDPDEVGWRGAVDLLNVDFDRPGRIRTRNGYTSLASVTNAITSLFAWPRVSGSVSTQILVGEGTRITALDNTGALIATDATPTSTERRAWVAFGSPTATVVYALNGNTDAPRKWTGAAWSTPTATVDGVAGRTMPLGSFVGLQATENRMVVARGAAATGPNGVASSASHVWFSEAGTPETWLSSSFVQLSPGDGEEITGVCSWREFVFVFKRTKYFVFYGNSTDSSGNAIFNYRTINTGVGANDQPSIVSTPEAVYFAGQGGVYRTTGGSPELVSREMNPIFRGTPTPEFYAGTLATSVTGPVQYMAWHRDRLYINYADGAGSPVLVFDPRTREWTLFSFNNGTGVGAVGSPIPMTSAVLSASTEPELLFAARSGNTIYRMRSASTTDNGTAITARYRSGFDDLGTAELKSVREWRLEGSGSPTLKVSHDFGANDTGAAVTLGVSPAILEARRRYATRGRHLAWHVEASTVFSLNNVVAHLREQRSPGTHSSS